MNERISSLGKVLRQSTIPADLRTSRGLPQVKALPGGQGIVRAAIKHQGRFSGKPPKIAQTGQFIISQFHPLKQLWGIVPSAFDKVEIPPTYLVFDLDSALDPDYFAVFVTTDTFRQAVFEASRKSGRLFLRDFKEIRFPLPSRDVQHHIANLAQTIHELLEASSIQYSAVATLKQNVILNLLQQTNPSWEATTLGKCAAITRSERKSYPLVIISSETILENTEIPLGGGVGLDPTADLNGRFLRYYLESQQSLLASAFKQGDLAFVINTLMPLPLLLPTLYEQQKMVSAFELFDQALKSLESETTALHDVLDRLVNRLFAGDSNWQQALPRLIEIVAQYR